MQGKNLKHFLFFLGFLAFATVSCWATAESLHMLLPSWPAVFCWLVTAGFFVVASIGSKMLVDSLNTSIYYPHRRLSLAGGIVLLILFWILFSMPTNMHTFFYRANIYEVALQDVSTTKSYVQQLADNRRDAEQAKQEVEKMETKVKSILQNLDSEINNSRNPGFGDVAKGYLNDLATALGVPTVATLSGQGTSPAQRRKLIEDYHRLIYGMMKERAEEIRKSFVSERSMKIKPQATKLVADLGRAEEALADAKAKSSAADGIDKDLISRTGALLSQGYVLIRNNADLVTMKEEDKPVYLVERPVTRTDRLLSVIDMVKDFFGGKYDGLSVATWLLVSILVDVTAFIFFDAAFRKEEY